VSTRDRSQDVENQLVQLRDVCGKQGWTVEHEYVDKVTGKHSDRSSRSSFRGIAAAV